MVTPLQNKSREQLLAEFDAVFGGYNLSLQKPTTNRRKDIPTLILPSELKISDVLTSLGKPVGERYLLILSHFYISGLLFKKQTGKLGNFIGAHRDTLRLLGGAEYLKLINYGISEEHLVKSPKKFIPGKQSNEYRLDQKTFSLENQQRYELTSKKAITIRSEQFRTLKNKFIKTGPVYRKIAASIDGLTFDYTKAIKYVAGIPNKDKLASRRNCIEEMLLGQITWVIDQQRRNHTVLVRMAGDLRSFVYYGKEPIYAVDISACHPLLAVLLYSKDSAEKKRYQSIVESGRFWEFINDAAGKPFNLLDPDDKDKLKQTLNRDVYYSFPEPKGGVKKLFGITFKREFPLLWSEIDLCKVRHSAKAASELSCIMQEMESILVFNAVETLLNRPYPLITIHDAVVTTKQGVADVEQALRDSFATEKLNPRLVVKRLTV